MLLTKMGRAIVLGFLLTPVSVLSFAQTSSAAPLADTIIQINSGYASVAFTPNYLPTLMEFGVNVTGVSPSMINSQYVLTFPVVGGSVDETKVHGEYLLGGGLQFQIHSATIRFTNLKVKILEAGTVVTGETIVNGKLLGRSTVLTSNLLRP